MTIRVKSENNEPHTLSDPADFHGWRALEIGLRGWAFDLPLALR